VVDGGLQRYGQGPGAWARMGKHGHTWAAWYDAATMRHCQAQRGAVKIWQQRAGKLDLQEAGVKARAASH